MSIPYLYSLRERARQMRKQQTRAEALFWECVRNRRCLGYKFTRQKPILSYIADFYCHELGLIIEIDGGVHDSQKEYDQIRTNDLESYGLTILRFSNDEILSDISEAMKKLKDIIAFLASSPSLPEREGRGVSV
jgi:very-short-patch-repair endonuclease